MCTTIPRKCHAINCDLRKYKPGGSSGGSLCTLPAHTHVPAITTDVLPASVATLILVPQGGPDAATMCPGTIMVRWAHCVFGYTKKKSPGSDHET